MNRYVIASVSGQPDWSKVETLSVDNIMWLPDAGIRMTQQLCHDEEKIYIRQRAVEANIRAEYDSPLGMVCQDSCMEFFFGPGEVADRYFNFEWNFNGCLYLGFGHGREDSVRLLPADPKKLFAFHSEKTQDGWELTYEIPASFVRLFVPEFTMDSGAVLRANCYKCGDLTPQEHYLSWNPMTSPTPDFHRPEDFGQMILG